MKKFFRSFSWLADSLAAIAENTDWKIKRKEDLNRIKLLSNGLIEGVEEEGLNLANLYIPGLSRHYIKKLLHAGYNNKQCLKELSIEELAKVLPQKLAWRIKKGMKEVRDCRVASLLAMTKRGLARTIIIY
ncbi:unnamed protein product [marine sediment metagenome]|uniref:Uncharacterized protein n=1 Tax=marine sediment metagenome TaxID=412755 RepID=X1E7F0_9ZZZZ